MRERAYAIRPYTLAPLDKDAYMLTTLQKEVGQMAAE
jgi:hypothetical protein